MWIPIETLPGIAGPVFLETDELISDAELRPVPDTDTRNAIARLVVDKLTHRDGATRRIMDLRTRCHERLDELRRANQVAMLPPKELAKQTAGWEQIALLCDSHVAAQAARHKIAKHTLDNLLQRWLLLRMEAIEGINARHSLGGFTVDGGIIKPQSGVKKP